MEILITRNSRIFEFIAWKVFTRKKYRRTCIVQITGL